MIPVNENERLVWEDKEDNVRYFFRALTGENEAKFFDIVSSDSKDKPDNERRKILNEVFDFIVLGWESMNGEKISEYPADGKPSSCFKAADKNKFMEISMKLNRLTAEESKN